MRILLNSHVGVKAENLLDLDEDASPSTTQSPQESFNSFTANTATSNINHAPSPAQSNPVDDLLGLFGNATVSSPSQSVDANNDIFDITTTNNTQGQNKNSGLEDLLF